MSQKRILLAGLFHETNTFAPGEMGLDQFAVTLGRDWLNRKGDGSPTGSFLLEAERYGWEVVPSVDVRGYPGAMPSPEVLERFWSEFEKVAASPQAEGLDAIFLVLHGAFVSPGIPDVEGELLRRIRALPRLAALPIFGVLDLHGNITPAMAEHAQGLLAYRENPHTDAAETAVRAAALMEKALAERLELRTRFVPTRLVWPPTGTGTAVEPMRALEALARSEERDGIEAVNIFAGFAQADTPDTGVSFTIVYDAARVAPDRLDAISRELVALAEKNRHLGIPDEWELEEALLDAVEKGAFPALLVEPAENIGGGAPGDGTSVLRALLKHKVAGSGVVLWDPESVARLAGKEPGSVHELRVGGKSFPLDPGPVPVTARLLRLTDGKYELEDHHSHAASIGGIDIEMGPSAVVEVEGITLLLTSERSAPMDLGQWRSQGVEPSELKLIGVKAAVAHKQAYDKISKASYWVRTPGPCTSDLKSLPYQRLRRPVFPLDEA
ncbi:MAG TPA: M81 family metallopeptidase [Chthoniobacteraceae bacterium]|nr:M81 family metallopeptidase [Chthoniobacteraceae bacterium]